MKLLVLAAAMARMTWRLCVAYFFLALAVNANDRLSFKSKCLGFKPQAHTSKDAVLNRLEFVPSGTNLTFRDNDASCNRPSQIVTGDLCRVALFVPTSKRSGFHYELWLPEAWNGRTLATGNGGLDGSFGTNNGHNGTSGAAFYQNEDAVIDFSWRALHASVEVGRELTPLFYNKKLGKSYYIGCSLGGRQGIGNAERFPTDFDGIIAGSPAVDFNSLYSWRAFFFPITGDTSSPDFISADTWKTTIHNEVLRQCDYIDGVNDGIIEDPRLCHIDTQQLLCGYNNSTSTDCLSSAQVEKVAAIFNDYLWPNGTLLYPRVNPGGELLAADGLYSGKAYGPSADWFKYVILGDPSWDPTTYTVDDALLAVQKNPADIDTWPSSLAAFQDQGGKIITYHGQQDQQITSLNSIRFWERLAAEVDYDLDKMDSASSYGIPFDKDHNVLAAIVDWVEKAVAPDEIVGSKFVGDSVAGGIMYQHRHCRYPYRSTYSGDGDPLDMDSWHCVNFGGY
ncbi:hypothetical protein O1611_g2748 [Lasiodiplodia mahajangana]|uniref:Uncharacterized protein n=1 Tax=Lasiodiplodia mahajangana TaxID=1108764 RepID=A0ACC2JTN8_9PEZI|nr:hypothetical protein O1611_g2748 [Lasiodiplodia mahajangana]